MRRPTGGRAVLHADEVTYSIILPSTHPIAQLGVIASYQVLSRGLTLGLAQLGIEAQLARMNIRRLCRRQRRKWGRKRLVLMHRLGMNCWPRTQVGERKCVVAALLQHGSIPLTLVPQDLYRLLTLATRLCVSGLSKRLPPRLPVCAM